MQASNCPGMGQSSLEMLRPDKPHHRRPNDESWVGKTLMPGMRGTIGLQELAEAVGFEPTNELPRR